jgi:hypothetical protein
MHNIEGTQLKLLDVSFAFISAFTNSLSEGPT